MMPFIHAPEAFFWLVGFGIAAGAVLFYRRAMRMGLDRGLVIDMAVVSVAVGFVGSHLMSVVAYSPEDLVADPWILLDVTAGMSSFGGFLGGTVGVLALFRYRGVDPWPYSDPYAYGFTFAWIFGRLGCTLAHDHPGRPTDFFLAVDYPAMGGFPAGPRHDLGLYELLVTIALFAFFFARRERRCWAGWHMVVVMLVYVPVRFALDFLRTGDRLYGGLTGAQLLCIPLFAIGLYVWRRQKRRNIVVTVG